MAFFVSALASVVSTGVSAVTSAASAIAGAGSAAVTTVGAGGWVTTVAPAASTALTAAKVLTGVATVASGLAVFGDIRAGEERARLARAEAADLGITRRQEFLASEARANEIRANLIRTVGAQRVAFAASGVDISAGTAARVVSDTFRRGDLDLQIEKENRNLREVQRFRQQQQLYAEARLSKQSGLFRAAGRIGNTALDIARRF